MSDDDLNKILAKPGYRIESGIRSSFGKGAFDFAACRSGEIDDVESDSGDASLRAEKLQVNYSGKPEIRITFYRRRLADHSRAVSEKALVDCLQYAGLIEGDSEKEIRLTDVVQKKVETDEEERTEVEIIYESVDLDDIWAKAKENNSR